MHPTISTKEFISVTTQKLDRALTRVDQNQDGILSKAEAAQLPEQFQDNFANYKMWNKGRTDLAGFREAFTTHLRDTARAADQNGNGHVDNYEVGMLGDLQDSWWQIVDSH
jgi:hypothetical protein